MRAALLDGSWALGSLRLPKRAVFPLVLALIALAGVLSPLFDVRHPHGFPGVRLYTHISLDRGYHHPAWQAGANGGAR